MPYRCCRARAARRACSSAPDTSSPRTASSSCAARRSRSRSTPSTTTPPIWNGSAIPPTAGSTSSSGSTRARASGHAGRKRVDRRARNPPRLALSGRKPARLQRRQADPRGCRFLRRSHRECSSRLRRHPDLRTGIWRAQAHVRAALVPRPRAWPAAARAPRGPRRRARRRFAASRDGHPPARSDRALRSVRLPPPAAFRSLPGGPAQPVFREEALMPSFDIVSQVDRQEVKNAVEQTNKEIANRFDFKGSDARVEQNELTLTVYADDEFKLGQVLDVLRQRLAKRNVDVRALESGAVEKISGDKVKRPVTVKVGVPQEKAKQMQKLIKDSKIKVAASIQGDAVRVSGGKKDDLQAAIQLVRKGVTDLPLQFINFRD